MSKSSPRTDAQLRKELRKVGMCVKKVDGEYRVNKCGRRSDAAAYFTNDRNDALYSGMAMAAESGVRAAQAQQRARIHDDERGIGAFNINGADEWLLATRSMNFDRPGHTDVVFKKYRGNTVVEEAQFTLPNDMAMALPTRTSQGGIDIMRHFTGKLSGGTPLGDLRGTPIDGFDDERAKVKWLSKYASEIRRLLAGREGPTWQHYPAGHMYFAQGITPEDAARRYLKDTRYGRGLHLDGLGNISVKPGARVTYSMGAGKSSSGKVTYAGSDVVMVKRDGGGTDTIFYGQIQQVLSSGKSLGAIYPTVEE